MKLTKEEFSTIGQAIAMIAYPQRFKRYKRQEVCAKLLEIMEKNIPRKGF